MNHLSEGELRAYLDHELATDHAAQVQQHLTDCIACGDLLATLQTRSAHISALWYDEAVTVPSLTVARTRLQKRTVTEIAPKEKVGMQPKRRFQFRYAALATAAILMVALMFPPVQAWAAQVLGLFRVQQVTVLPVDFQSLSAIDENATDVLTQMLSDNVKGESVGEAADVKSWEEARAASGLAVRTPAAIQEAPTAIHVNPGASVDITMDAERLRALVAVMGREDIVIPDSLTGSVVHVEIPQGVQATWGECWGDRADVEPEDMMPSERRAMSLAGDCTLLMQIPSPTITTPPELDMNAIGQLYLELLGMSSEEAATFGATLDWSSTLVIPVPASEADFEEVVVDGVNGTLIRSKFRQANEPFILIWVKDGILYGLSGDGDNARALEIANSLK